MNAAIDYFKQSGFKTFAALGEANRLAIVELLREGELTVGQIADKLGMRQPQASKHLKVLSESGLVEVMADANRRIYKIKPEPFLSLESWLKTFKQQTEERYDKLDDYLKKMKTKKD